MSTSRARTRQGARGPEPGPTAAWLQTNLRRIDRGAYPELADYSHAEVYGGGDQLSPGGLFLADLMTRRLGLESGDRVLDIGCGLGDSSIFLAKHFDVEVIAVDLHTPRELLQRKIDERGWGARIVPMQLDVTQAMPFEDAYFDAVFCMTSIHYFGHRRDFLPRLLRHLKPGGRLAVANTCFNEEVADHALPAVFRATPPGSVLDSWEGETRYYHSPDWWARLFRADDSTELCECSEVEDGPVMWEDKLAFDLESVGWNAPEIRARRWKTDQILFGRDQNPYFTFFNALLRKTRPTRLEGAR